MVDAMSSETFTRPKFSNYLVASLATPLDEMLVHKCDRRPMTIDHAEEFAFWLPFLVAFLLVAEAKQMAATQPEKLLASVICSRGTNAVIPTRMHDSIPNTGPELYLPIKLAGETVEESNLDDNFVDHSIVEEILFESVPKPVVTVSGEIFDTSHARTCSNTLSVQSKSEEGIHHCGNCALPERFNFDT